MPDQVTTTSDSLMSGLRTGFTSFMDFLPALFGGLIVLVIGWFIAKIVARVVERLLHAVRFEHAVAHSRLGEYIPQSTPRKTASGLVGTLAKWFVFLIFVQAAANILRMPQVTSIINSILLFIPNLFIAMVILVIGVMAARFVGDMMHGSVSRLGASNPRIISLITRYAIIGFSVIAAVNQIGIATNLINILFAGLVASLTLAFGLAFGLGGQRVASDITQSWYDQGKSQASKLRSVPPELKRNL